MSLQTALTRDEQTSQGSATGIATAVGRRIKVLIPYDGSDNSEVALDDMRRAGLPQNLDALVAVTNVWLPSSPYEITRAVNARRMKLLTSGVSSFAPALRNYEEQRVLSFEASRRIGSIFPSANIRTEGMQDEAAITSEILRKAKTWGAELIILGAKASPSPNITDYAGPALRVAQGAHCSVRIARASDRGGDSPIRIMIGVGESDSPNRVVQAVTERFWPAGSEASIVVVRKVGPRDPVRDSATALELNSMADKLRAIGLIVSIKTRGGQPQDVLLQEARELSVDGIFIDSHGLGQGPDNGFDRRGLCKVAEALVLGTRCAVEVVRPKLTDPYWKPAA